MFKLFILFGVVVFCVACEKEITPITKPATQLLTQKEWILASYGYDENKNGNIDPSEENIKDCEKDNSYIFKQDESGNIFDNDLKCGNGVTDHTFNWQLVNNETGLDFVFGRASILLLTEDEFIIYQDIGNGNDIIRFIVRWRHR